MPKRDLKLNSLSRYSKDSPQFILEEHGHCEVPAGCGGVVLRWRNPNRGIPLSMWLYVAGSHEIFIDGTPPSSGRPIVSWGRHVLSLVVSEFDPRHTVLMFAAVHDEKEMIHVHTSRPAGGRVAILSLSDATWKYSKAEPAADSWMSLDFEDSPWSSMILKQTRRPASDQDRDSYRIKKLEEFGAKGLGVKDAGQKIWIRKVFNLQAPVAED